MPQKTFDFDIEYKPSPPFQRHSETSHEAAEAIAHPSARLRHLVYECIRDSQQQGLTDEEVQLALDMNPSTERPRRVELVNAGLVRASGRVRPTRSGRNAVVWVL